MSTAAAYVLFPHVVQEFGTVLSRQGATVRIGTSSGEYSAAVSASCLLSPAAGDRVLVVRGGEEAYVLAVVKTAGAAHGTELAFNGDVSLRIAEGRLRVVADEGLELVSPRSADVRVKTIRVIAEAVDTVAGRIYQRAVHFLRRTDEVDRIEAKHIERRADELLRMHGENTVATADQLVKINGAQVHVG
jgi:hypothetical protein